MLAVTDQDVSNILAIGAALTALYKSLVADRRSKQAKTHAEELVSMCSYPACGHVCESGEGKLPPPPYPRLPLAPGMETE